MGFLKNLLKGGPQYMKQDLFNTVVFTAYLPRCEFDSFHDFWHGNLIGKDGKKVNTTEILTTYGSHFRNDEFLRLGWGKAMLGIEKHFTQSHSINQLDFYIIRQIVKLSNEIHPNGEKIKPTSLIGGESHPNPEIRVQQCIDDFILYEDMVVNN